jgi:hypothetical protein
MWRIVADVLEIELPRVPDRDELLSSLREHGFDARAVDRDGFCALKVMDAGAGRELMEAVDTWIAESGVPLVPEHMSEGSCLLRPSGD